MMHTGKVKRTLNSHDFSFALSTRFEVMNCQFLFPVELADQSIDFADLGAFVR